MRLTRQLFLLGLAIPVLSLLLNAQSTSGRPRGGTLDVLGLNNGLVLGHDHRSRKLTDATRQPDTEIQDAAKVKVYNFATVDYPGAALSVVLDLNNDCNAPGPTAVGYFSYRVPGGLIAFTFKGGVYRTLTIPNTIESGIDGINCSGQMVGFYYDSANAGHGFLDAGGSVTTIDFPGAVGTGATDINDSGVIVGQYNDTSYHGFVYDAGKFTSIDFPGASFTSASGINSAGDIVGYYLSDSQHGFLLSGGVFTSIDYPGGSGTVADGINDHGDIVGSYSDASAHLIHGYIYSGTFRTVDVPGVTETTLTRIRNNGRVTGLFEDAVGEDHGMTGH